MAPPVPVVECLIVAIFAISISVFIRATEACSVSPATTTMTSTSSTSTKVVRPAPPLLLLQPQLLQVKPTLRANISKSHTLGCQTQKFNFEIIDFSGSVFDEKSISGIRFPKFGFVRLIKGAKFEILQFCVKI